MHTKHKKNARKLKILRVFVGSRTVPRVGCFRRRVVLHRVLGGLLVAASLAAWCSYALCDCPHCYCIIEVNLFLRNGVTMEGYIPYYGWYADSVSVTKGNDIKPNLLWAEYRPNPEGLSFYANMHFFKDVTFGATEEDVVTIRLSDIDSLKCGLVTDYCAAGPVNILSVRTVTLLSRKIRGRLVIADKHGNYDWVYANCSSGLSQAQFSGIIDLVHTRFRSADPYLNFADLEIANRRNDDKLIDRTMQRAARSIEYLSSEIDSVAESTVDSVIAEYARRYALSYRERLRLFHGLCGSLLDFLDKQNHSDDSFVTLQEQLVALFGNDPIIVKMSLDEEAAGTEIWSVVGMVLDAVRPHFDGMHRKLLEEMDIVVAKNHWD